MTFEWDEAKRRRNLAKHGIDFADAARIWQRPLVRRRDTRREYGEERWIALGELDGLVVCLVYTPRAGKTRLISIRLASNDERETYRKKIRKPD